ncbi:hypothetical protein Tco_1357489 [Tanacetum coccineum]
MKSMADKQRADKEFKEEDWVVLQRVEKVAYKVKLPAIAQVHNVFHVSHLKKCKKEEITTMGSFPHCKDDGLIVVTPMAKKVRKTAHSSEENCP